MLISQGNMSVWERTVWEFNHEESMSAKRFGSNDPAKAEAEDDDDRGRNGGFLQHGTLLENISKEREEGNRRAKSEEHGPSW